MKAKYILQSDRVCRALTGLNVYAFNRLLENFTWIYNQHINKLHKLNCKPKTEGGRAFGGGRIGAFGDYADKLFLVLFWLKVYPTEEVMGAFFGIHSSTAGICLRKFRPIVEEVLGKIDSLPKRKITSLDQLFTDYPELEEIYIDGTDRPVQRKQNTKASNKNYSKKKKTHTRKNVTVVGKGKTGDKREILILTPTRNGRRHDKKITDKDQIYRFIPPELETYQDTGFLGANKNNQHQDNPNFHIPKKKSKNQPLTDQGKLLNQLISSIRVTVEHGNWGLKRLNSIMHTFRHKLSQLDDTCILLASGIWNFHLLHNKSKQTKTA
jgi:hypothetical protein